MRKHKKFNQKRVKQLLSLIELILRAILAFVEICLKVKYIC
jgi:hypothetical protein